MLLGSPLPCLASGRLRDSLAGKTPTMSFREPSSAPDTAAEPTPPVDPATAEPAQPTAAQPDPSPAAVTGRNMLPERERRRFGVERLLVRLVATCGIVGIGVALGATLVSSNVQGWITGLVVALVSVVLSAILWSSRQV